SDQGEYLRDRAKTAGDGWFIPPLTPAQFGVTDPADVAWITPLLTPVTTATFEQSVRLSNPRASQLPRTFVSTGDEFDGPAGRARSAGWDFHELKVGHDSMITAPRELADLLLAIAAL